MSADFRVAQVTEERVFIVDTNLGSKSVTNDAEAVVEKLLAEYGPKRIIYCDSSGHWDEIVHNGKEWVGFGPWLGLVPASEGGR